MVIQDKIIITTHSKKGYIIEKGVTNPISELFGELIPVKILSLHIRPIKPYQSAVTKY